MPEDNYDFRRVSGTIPLFEFYDLRSGEVVCRGGCGLTFARELCAGLNAGTVRPETADDAPPHSAMDRAAAIREARRLGDASEGDGWRRLLWRMADLLEGEG